MLTNRPGLTQTLVYTFLAALQLAVLSQYDLFTDEAFYWLEGQHLDWSYAELPGWTAWLLALSESIFPHHPAFLRLIPWLAALSIPWLTLAINGLISPQQGKSAFGLIWALPLVGVVSILALPDVWLLFFAFLTVYLTLLTLKKDHSIYFIALGLSIACGINVHVRFWFFIFIFAATTLYYHKEHPACRKLISISLPISLLGLVPILIFNLQHNFPLLSFQFDERHPWMFQADHFWFFIVQLIVCTPLVFALWFKGILTFKQLTKRQKAVVLAAILHWLLYALLGFFSDNLRLNLHWPLLSYGLVFAVIIWRPSRQLNWTLWSGWLTHAFALMLLLFWLYETPPSATNMRITNNAMGAQLLAKETTTLREQHQKTRIITDHFMTAAALLYHSPYKNIKTMAHTLNDKHGRSQQLEVMNLLLTDPFKSTDLLVIEQTSLKLEQQVDYFMRLCQQSSGIRWLAQTDIRQGSRIYHYFEPSFNGDCALPLLFYAELNEQNLSGWVLAKPKQIDTLALTSTGQLLNLQPQSTEGHSMFNPLPKEKYQLHYFHCQNCVTDSTQIKAQLTDGSYQVSHRIH